MNRTSKCSGSKMVPRIHWAIFHMTRDFKNNGVQRILGQHLYSAECKNNLSTQNSIINWRLRKKETKTLFYAQSLIKCIISPSELQEVTKQMETCIFMMEWKLSQSHGHKEGVWVHDYPHLRNGDLVARKRILLGVAYCTLQISLKPHSKRK